jgi:protein SCO1/2
MITKQPLARTAGRLLALTILLTLSACRGPRPCCEAAATAPAHEGVLAAAGVRTFAVRGVVREIRDGSRQVVIRHEEIPGYMAAMTMTFDVKDPGELAAVAAGDRVAFRMTVTETDGWIDRIEVLERGVPEEAKPEVPGVRIVRQVEELEEGDLLPDYPLVTESRQAIRLEAFRGRALGFTFIYTRCPYPTFCPRQSRQFAEATRRLKELLPGPDPRWHLLSISFDPANDTPPVLLRYARQYDFDPAWWSFCTGAMIEIDALTEQFGMLIGRDGETFSHNVRTVVVEPSGRIRRIFVGNEWTVEELVGEMVQAAAAP